MSSETPVRLTPQRLEEIKREIRREDVHLLYGPGNILELLAEIDALTAEVAAANEMCRFWQGAAAEARIGAFNEAIAVADALDTFVAQKILALRDKEPTA